MNINKIESEKSINKKTHPTQRQKRQQTPLLILAIFACILSTLSVQIYQLHYGPYVRTLQCYFNLNFLMHDSWDIYQAVQVVYWRTDQYVNREDISNFFVRISDTIRNLEFQSFIALDSQKMQKQGIVKMQAQYFKNGLNSEITFFYRSVKQLDLLFSETLLQRTFCQYLRNVKLVIILPIIQYQHHTGIKIQVQLHFDSGLLMQATVNADPIRIQHSNEQNSQHKNKTNSFQTQFSNLQIRKIQSYMKMELQIVYLIWINVGLNAIIFIMEFWGYMLDYRKLQHREQRAYQNYQKQMLLLKVQNSHQKLKNSIQNVANAQYIIKKLGMPRLLAMIISLLAVIGYFYGTSDGLLCLFCWFRVVTHLSSTSNPLMIGILFKRAIPIYAKILINLFIILTAFVLLSMVVYQVTIKFQTLQLSYYQYLFNYFQYGIYQNFIALAPYDFAGQFLYFVQLFILINIGNNILQSILAGQILKNSNQRNLEEMLESLQYRCPNCYSVPKVKKTLQINSKEKSRFFSKIVEDNFLQSKLTQAYEIKILSPKLSPYFIAENKQPASPLKKFKQKNVQKGMQKNSQSSQFMSKLQKDDSQKLIFQIGDQNQIIADNQFHTKIKKSRESIQALLYLIYHVDNKQPKRNISSQQKLQIFIILKPLIRKIDTLIKQKVLSI